jgi:spermidine synthase
MKPWETIDRARAADGAELVLARRGDEWAVRAAGRVLMSSRVHGSEEALAAFALERAANRRSVLVGGLGFGFTLRAALDRLPPDAKVVVVELVPELVAWNRGPLAALAGRPLDDPRVRVQRGDVRRRIEEAKRAYDAILLDVDNGPSALAHRGNDALYGMRGLGACREALRDGGVLAVWSAGPDAAFRERLERAGFTAEERSVAARGKVARGVKHVLFLGTPGGRGPRGPGPRGGARSR